MNVGNLGISNHISHVVKTSVSPKTKDVVITLDIPPKSPTHKSPFYRILKTGVRFCYQHGGKILAAGVSLFVMAALINKGRSAFSQNGDSITQRRNSTKPEHAFSPSRRFIEGTENSTVLNPIPNQTLYEGQTFNMRLYGLDLFGNETITLSAQGVPPGINSATPLVKREGLVNGYPLKYYGPNYESTDIAGAGKIACLSGSNTGNYPLRFPNPAASIKCYKLPGLTVTGSFMKREVGPSPLIKVSGNNAVFVNLGHPFYPRYNPGFSIVKINGSPTLLGSVTVSNDITGIEIDKETVYVAMGQLLQVYDIKNPGSPTLISSVNAPGDTKVIKVSGNNTIIGGDFGVQIYDANNPANLTLKATIPTSGIVREITMVGNHAYVIGDFGLKILDVSSSGNPKVVGTHDTVGKDLTVSKGHVYVLNTNRITILDARNFTDIKKVFYQWRPVSVGLMGYEDKVLVASNRFGLESLKYRPDGLGLYGKPTVAGIYTVGINGNNGTHSFFYEFNIEVLKRPAPPPAPPPGPSKPNPIDPYAPF